MNKTLFFRDIFFIFTVQIAKSMVQYNHNVTSEEKYEYRIHNTAVKN